MHGLQLPRKPTQPLPPLASSSSSSEPLPLSPPPLALNRSRPQPPPNFAQQRTQARTLRGEKKSPFVPKKTQQSTNHFNLSPSSQEGFSKGYNTVSNGGGNARGKERDLSTCSIEQLRDMLNKNQLLLDSPETFLNLPGGDSRLRLQQNRIETRLKELIDMSEIKRELDATHLETDEERSIKREEEDGMQDVTTNKEGLGDEASSPQTKKRIVARIQASNPHSMSLTESLQLQRQAVARDRIQTERRQTQMELDEKRPERTGGLLRSALGNTAASGNKNLGSFMFAGNDEDSDEELDEEAIEDWLNQGRTGVNGELNEEENEQLNPLKTAYMTGWNRAAAEEG
ncbi:hypothetical protein JCM5353_006193 [Sporobolomyces roseus]